MEIFFHVGLGKTGTKYLQFDFFPKLKGVFYIRPTLYRKSPYIIKFLVEFCRLSKPILVSREFDVQLEDEIKWFQKSLLKAGLKNTKVKCIVVVRRHDEWILSQFKRFLKNGYHITFDDFFNFSDTGIFKTHDLFFTRKIEAIREVFRTEPLVLTYDTLREKPLLFLKAIAKFVGVYPDTIQDDFFSKISLKPRHTSYSEKQLTFAWFISTLINYLPPQNPIKKYLVVYPIRYGTLWIGRLIPNIPAMQKARLKIFPSKERLKKIRAFYKEDWEECRKIEAQWFDELGLS